MNFLAQRPPRERILIIGAGILVALFVVWQFGFKSVIDAGAKAERAHVKAERDLSIVRAGLPSLSPQTTSSTKAALSRTAVINTARGVNISISRVQPGPDGTLQVWFDDSPMPTVYNFLSRLSSGHAVEISRVQMTRRDGGVVSAQLTLKPAS